MSTNFKKTVLETRTDDGKTTTVKIVVEVSSDASTEDAARVGQEEFRKARKRVQRSVRDATKSVRASFKRVMDDMDSAFNDMFGGDK